MRIGKCSKCGKEAAWNTPHIDGKGNLFCNRCAYESPEMLIGIDQYTDYQGHYKPDRSGVRTKNHCVVWTNLDHMTDWTDDGGRGYRLTDEEKALAVSNPEKLLDKMAAMRAANRYRCTGCGSEMAKSEVYSFPLFSGVACSECGKEHDKQIEHERKTGQVCRMCKQPYSLCCC